MPRTRRQHDARFKFKVALAAGLHDYFQLYNYERPHQSLGYRTPADVDFAVNEPLSLSV